MEINWDQCILMKTFSKGAKINQHLYLFQETKAKEYLKINRAEFNENRLWRDIRFCI